MHVSAPRLSLLLLAPCLFAAGILATPGLCQEPGSRPATRAGTRPHPLSKDHTGIRWVYPFRKALAKAKAEGRLLLFLPLAGGTNQEGDW